jgi:hypothetical protein
VSSKAWTMVLIEALLELKLAANSVLTVPVEALWAEFVTVAVELKP